MPAEHNSKIVARASVYRKPRIPQSIRYNFSSLLEAERYTCTGLEMPRGLHDVEAPRISRQTGHEGDKVAIPTHRSPLLPREDTGYLFG